MSIDTVEIEMTCIIRQLKYTLNFVACGNQSARDITEFCSVKMDA